MNNRKLKRVEYSYLCYIDGTEIVSLESHYGVDDVAFWYKDHEARTGVQLEYTGIEFIDDDERYEVYICHCVDYVEETA